MSGHEPATLSKYFEKKSAPEKGQGKKKPEVAASTASDEAKTRQQMYKEVFPIFLPQLKQPLKPTAANSLKAKAPEDVPEVITVPESPPELLDQPSSPVITFVPESPEKSLESWNAAKKSKLADTEKENNARKLWLNFLPR